MKILLTGANGFFGKIVQSQLSDHQITTMDLVGSDSDVDLSKQIPVITTDFELVVHAAGKAHSTPKSVEEEQLFYDVNVTGTMNLLNGIDASRRYPKTIVFTSTVSVYGVAEGIGLSESTPLLGNTAYGLSKLQAEKVLQDWGLTRNVNIVVLRLPLLVGPNAPGTLASMMKGIQKGYYFRIGNGMAKRSMVLAEDVASFLPGLIHSSGIFHLTDGHHPTLGELDEAIAHFYGRSVKKIPDPVARLLAKIGDFFYFLPINSLRYSKLSMPLVFNDQKARTELNWTSRSVLTIYKQ